LLRFKNLLFSTTKNNIWVVPFFFVIAFITVLSCRLLSDPDLGFHLNAGKYIVENKTVPDKDSFTYTSTQNDYIDLHWLFQIIIYSTYKITGYEGLSVLVLLLSFTLCYLLLLRNQRLKIPLSLSCLLIFAGYLIIESRIILRPELFTYIFITLSLLVLDQYYLNKKRMLYFLPIIMLFWCNMHSLFILSFVFFGSYFLSIWVRDKKFDKYLFSWLFLACITCFLNPYFIKGFTFPLELFTRFDSNNVFNQNIKELKSYFHSDIFELKNLLFLIFLCTFVLLFIYNIRKRKLHEFIILPVFIYLALVSIRNIPLFIIIALPISGSIILSIKEKLKHFNKLLPVVYYSLIILSVGLIFRLFTNSFYISNNSPYKTGFGIDEQQQPVNSAEFLNRNYLNGKILNSLGIGGWLSWSTSQPVFIDGRLEVIKEDIYKEVVASWRENGLSKLLLQYKPNLIVYNYPKYHTWTDQLSEMPDWRLLYLDGSVAVFVSKNFAPNLHPLDFNDLLITYHLQQYISESEKIEIINHSPKGKFMQWIDGFYKKTDYSETSLLNIASFCMQLKDYDIAERFFLTNYKKTEGNNNYVLYALADIYKIKGNKNLSQICCTNILKFDSEIKMALSSLEKTKKNTTVASDTNKIKSKENDAITFFNSGNAKYQNKDIQGAISDYDKAIAIKPDYFKAYNNRGIIKASELNLNNEALKDFDKAIELKPDYSDAYLGRGSVKFSMKDISGACNDWEKAYNLGNAQAKLQIDKYCHNK